MKCHNAANTEPAYLGVSTDRQPVKSNHHNVRVQRKPRALWTKMHLGITVNGSRLGQFFLSSKSHAGETGQGLPKALKCHKNAGLLRSDAPKQSGPKVRWVSLLPAFLHGMGL